MVVRFASCGDWGVVWCGGTCWIQGLPFGVVSVSKSCCKIIIQSQQLNIDPKAKGFFRKSDLYIFNNIFY